MKKRLVYIDVMRVFAMLLVILAHSCAAVLVSHSKNWQVANSFVIVTEVAVPLFFMISGAMLLNSPKTASLKYLFKHRMTRILVPFIVWSIISAFVNSVIFDKMHINAVDSILKMYHQPVLIAYWFIYPLISLYLLSPLLKSMVEHVDDGMLTYLLILFLVFIIALPVAAKSLPNGLGVYFKGYPQGELIASESLAYFVLGYRLTRGKHRHINTWLNMLLIVLLMGIKIWISFLVVDKSLRYLNIVSALILPLVTILIYLALRSLEPHYPRWFVSLIEYVAPLTYGVYLLHGIVILTLEKYMGASQYGWIFFLTTFISVAIIMILHSIPGIRRLFT